MTKQKFKTELEELQEKRSQLLIELYKYRQVLNSAKTNLKNISFNMANMDDTIAYWVMNNTGRLEEADFFRKRIAKRKSGMFNTKTVQRP